MPDVLDEQLLGAERMLDENLEIKRQQLRTLTQKLMETQNKITSARLHFESECKAKRSELSLEHARRMKEVKQLMGEADDQARAAEESYYRQTQLEKEAERELLAVNAHKQKLADLNVERIEIAKLRRQAESELQTAQALKDRAQSELQLAQSKLDEANAKLAKADQMHLSYQEDWNNLKAEKDEVTRQLKQYQLLKEEIDGKLDKNVSNTKKEKANAGSTKKSN